MAATTSSSKRRKHFNSFRIIPDRKSPIDLIHGEIVFSGGHRLYSESAAASPSGCTNGQAFDNSAFTCIFYPKSDLANCAPAAPDPSAVIGMLDIFPRLQRQNVTISYQPTNLGFVGRPGGPPMAVTVGMGGLTHQIYFIGPIMRFFGGNFAANPPILAFAGTLN